MNFILSKMERFGLCDKFLDQQGFLDEYKREVSKKSRTKIKK